MNRVIAFFDFDGTVTSKDSLLQFIRHVKGDVGFYLGFLIHSPILVLYKLKILSNHRAKEIMLNYFFGRMKAEDFNKHCENFIANKLPKMLRPKAVKEIQKLKDAGAEVVIVSASPENWITGWCDTNELKCVATKLVTEDGRITGRINGLNCHGREKVRRINEGFNLREYSSVYAYGDTPADKYMLSIADYRFYKPFR
ncbi:MAG: HAD-IB family hydrolase [Chitinophagaceae bacterium]|nr:HAD-IB family hydrolase [Chitinophagaceae bacterium]